LARDSSSSCSGRRVPGVYHHCFRCEVRAALARKRAMFPLCNSQTVMVSSAVGEAAEVVWSCQRCCAQCGVIPPATGCLLRMDITFHTGCMLAAS
jgi:hypothetical protein